MGISDITTVTREITVLTFDLCIGAKAAGMRTAWVNRRQRLAWDVPLPPDLIVRDFTELAAVLRV
jgi:FMN phosphatase YigB (HAD superfamily)